jgi:hypothetical protein
VTERETVHRIEFNADQCSLRTHELQATSPDQRQAAKQLGAAQFAPHRSSEHGQQTTFDAGAHAPMVGVAHTPSVPILRVLALLIPINVTGVVFGLWLITLHQDRLEVAVLAGAAQVPD